MTAIRKLDLQYTCFQHFTSKTTEIGYSNDRFGINNGNNLSTRNIQTIRIRSCFH